MNIHTELIYGDLLKICGIIAKAFGRGNRHGATFWVNLQKYFISEALQSLFPQDVLLSFYKVIIGCLSQMS